MNRRNHGGARAGSGPKPKPADELSTRVTFSMLGMWLDAVDATAAPRSRSRYISDLIERDLKRERRKRFDRVREVSYVEGATVRVIVPIDDIPLWTWARWRVVKLDDVRGVATLTYTYETQAAADAMYNAVEAVLAVRS